MKLGELVTLAGDQLGLLALAIPAAVLVAARRAPRYLLLTGSATIITVLFNEAYSNADIQRYYLGPVLWVWTWLGILGAEVAALAGVVVAGLAGGPASARGARTLARGTALAAMIVGVVLLLPALGDLDARRKLADRSSESGAARWLDEALPVLAQDAVIVSWWSTSTPLWYAQHVEGRRTDVFVVDDRTMLDLRLGRAPDVINRFLDEGRAVYAIRLQGRDLDELTGQFDMTKVASDGNTAVYAVNGRLAAIQ
jgi:hypothetical protein